MSGGEPAATMPIRIMPYGWQSNKTEGRWFLDNLRGIHPTLQLRLLHKEILVLFKSYLTNAESIRSFLKEIITVKTS